MDGIKTFDLRGNNRETGGSAPVMAALVLLGFLGAAGVVELYVGLTLFRASSTNALVEGWILTVVGIGFGGLPLILGWAFVRRPAEHVRLQGSKVCFIGRRGDETCIDLAQRTSTLSLRRSKYHRELYTLVRPYGIRAFLSQDAVEAIEAVAIQNARRTRRNPPSGAASGLLSIQIERG